MAQSEQDNKRYWDNRLKYLKEDNPEAYREFMSKYDRDYGRGLMFKNAVHKGNDDVGLLVSFLAPTPKIGFLGKAGTWVQNSFFGRGYLRAKEALGFYGTKVGGGGHLQPASKISGQYVDRTVTFIGRQWKAVANNVVQFGQGITTGYYEGYTGVSFDIPAYSGWNNTGQTIGQIAGSISQNFY